MRILLTGATGYIGLAVLEGLVRAGHHVTGLARGAEKARIVSTRGGHPLIGDLSDPPSYREAVSSEDGVVHAGFESSARGPAVDRTAIETMVAALRAANRAPGGAPRFLIYTSGIWVLGPATVAAAEDAPVNPVSLVSWRPAHERLVLDAAADGLRTIVVRPGIVYGGGGGIVGAVIKDAANGIVRIIGTGENRWPAVFDRDLADLYVRLAGRANAGGIYHACDESDERVNDIVGAIAAEMRVAPEIRRMPLEEARSKMGAYADALALDQLVRCPRAHVLGWTPTMHGISRNAARLVEEWRNANLVTDEHDAGARQPAR